MEDGFLFGSGAKEETIAKDIIQWCDSYLLQDTAWVCQNISS
jgi:hypothetical protein